MEGKATCKRALRRGIWKVTERKHMVDHEELKGILRNGRILATATVTPAVTRGSVESTTPPGRVLL